VNTHRTLRKVFALFGRDLAIARSYRTAFAIEILEAFFLFGQCSYVDRLCKVTLEPGRLARFPDHRASRTPKVRIF